MSKVDALASRHQGRALPLPHSAAPSWNSAAAAPSWPSAQERRVVPATPRNPNCLLLESTHWELESGERGWMAANRKLQCAVWKQAVIVVKTKDKRTGATSTRTKIRDTRVVKPNNLIFYLI